MAVAYRADVVAGDASTATTTSLAFTIPASAVAGDVALVGLSLNTSTPTVTTPSGWTLQSGPDVASTNATGYIFSKTLVSGDVSSTVTFTISAATKASGELSIISGGTSTGIILSKTVSAGAVSTATVPTVAGVPAGAEIVVFLTWRGAATPGPDCSTPAGYTSGSRAATTVSTGAQTSIETVYKTVASAGTYGGESFTIDQASQGTTYTIAVPAVARTGKMNYWTGTAWVAHPVKVWNGSAWVIHPAKVWNGSAWITGK